MFRCRVSFVFCFFFNDTATTEIYTLSLHDALPICETRTLRRRAEWRRPCLRGVRSPVHQAFARDRRSEEHTSELQSQSNLVCRLLLEKKKKKKKKQHQHIKKNNTQRSTASHKNTFY